MYKFIFGQLSLEKRNVGKPVQQMRVLLILQQMISLQGKYTGDKFWNTWDLIFGLLRQTSDTQISPCKPLHQSMWFPTQSQHWTTWICVETTWGLCVVASSYLQWPTATLWPQSQSPLISSYSCNFSPCKLSHWDQSLHQNGSPSSTECVPGLFSKSPSSLLL